MWYRTKFGVLYQKIPHIRRTARHVWRRKTSKLIDLHIDVETGEGRTGLLIVLLWYHQRKQLKRNYVMKTQIQDKSCKRSSYEVYQTFIWNQRVQRAFQTYQVYCYRILAELNTNSEYAKSTESKIDTNQGHPKLETLDLFETKLSG